MVRPEGIIFTSAVIAARNFGEMCGEGIVFTSAVIAARNFGEICGEA